MNTKNFHTEGNNKLGLVQSPTLKSHDLLRYSLLAYEIYIIKNIPVQEKPYQPPML